MARVHGLHHITGIAGPASENHRFYTDTLGMRMVKRSVNQDDPKTYHLFYADANGSPGTDLTFFPWAEMAPARPGHGVTSETLLAVPTGSLGFWADRLAAHGVVPDPIETRFGEQVLPFADPHGLRLALAETYDPRNGVPWDGSPVPAEHQILGLHGARFPVARRGPTDAFLTGVFQLTDFGEENGWRRYGLPREGGLDGAASGTWVDVAERPDLPRGAWGTGTIHHIAWRVDDEAEERDTREAVEQVGLRPTPVIDRFWFRSVYFKEPGGVLFELATDGPGFGVDEAMETLGEALVLPPWLEPYRDEIEAGLPTLDD